MPDLTVALDSRQSNAYCFQLWDALGSGLPSGDDFCGHMASAQLFSQLGWTPDVGEENTIHRLTLDDDILSLHRDFATGEWGVLQNVLGGPPPGGRARC